MRDGEIYFGIGFWLALIGFVATWWHLAATYSSFWTVAFGWVPGLAVAAAVWIGWPLVLIGVGAWALLAH